MRTPLALLAVTIAVLAWASPAQAGWTSLGGTLNANDQRNAGPPKIATIAGIPWVSWVEMDGVTNRTQVRVARLNGGTFQAVGGSVNESESVHAFGTSIASVSGEAWVAKSEDSGGSAEKVQVKRWNGSAWVAVGVGFPEISTTSPAITTVGGVAYVAYVAFDGGVWEVRVRRWSGAAWELVGAPLAMDGLGADTRPAIADIAGVPYVTYMPVVSGKVVMRVALFNGTSWSPVGGVISRAAADFAVAPSLVDLGGGVPAIGWTELDTFVSTADTLVARWNGTAWVAMGTPLASGVTAYGPDAPLTIVAGRPYLGWVENAKVVVSDWNGTRWTRVGGALNRGGSSDGGFPVLTNAGGAPVAAWAEWVGSGNRRVFASRLDFGATAAFTATGYTVGESAGSATITVRRTGSTAGTATVDFALTNGTANGADYTASAGTLTFGDGVADQALLVPIADDGTPETNETVNLTLSNPAGDLALGSPSTAVLTIVDDDVIDTLWVVAPEGTIADSRPPFIFVAEPSAGATFECSLDSAPYASCTSPFQQELAQGSHRFSVRAVAPGGERDATPLTREVFVDTVRPVTTLDAVARSAPPVQIAPSTTDAAPSSGVRETRCAVDPAAVPDTASDLPAGSCPATLTTPGTHTVYAAGIDNAGNAGLPAKVTVEVLAVPETTITSAPEGDIWETTPSFEFTSSIPGSSFRCRVDGAAFAPCTSPYPSAELVVGAHAFEVQATSPAGAADPTPARAAFSIARKAQQRGTCEFNVTNLLYDLGIQGCLVNKRPTACPFVGACGPNDPTCQRVLTCRYTTAVCPAGAICTVRGTVSWFDADPRVDWSAGMAIGYATYQGVNWGYFVSRANCSSNGAADRCLTPEASYTTFGIGQPLMMLCSSVVGGGGTRDSDYGPASIRRMKCEYDTTITAAPAAGVVARGTEAQAYAPGPGTVELAPAGASARGALAVVSAAKRAPAFKRARKTAKAAGPVTFSLKLSPAARKTLAAKKKLVVAIKVTFKPKGAGKATTRTTRTTLRKLVAAKAPKQR